MPELMKSDDKKQRQILDYVPGDRRVTAPARTDFKRGYNKPGPMQKDIDSQLTETNGESLGECSA